MATKYYRVRTRLPMAYNTAIGRSITRFSVIEGRLRKIIYGLLELDGAYGRIAVRNPRVEDSLTMVQELIALRGFTTSIEFKGEGGLISACKRLEKFRDMVAHGVWAYHEKHSNPILQVTAGSYQENPGGPNVKARIAPQALNVTLANFRHNASEATEVYKAIDFLAAELQKQHVALLKRRHEQLRQAQSLPSPRTTRNPAKRKSQRTP